MPGIGGIRSFSIKLTARFRVLKRTGFFAAEIFSSHQSIYFVLSSVLATRSSALIFTSPKERRNKGQDVMSFL